MQQLVLYGAYDTPEHNAIFQQHVLMQWRFEPIVHYVKPDVSKIDIHAKQLLLCSEQPYTYTWR